MNKKRLIIVASLVMAVALVTASTTMAYQMNRANPVKNVFVPGTITPDIHENSGSTPAASMIIPTESCGYAPKKVQLQNVDNTESGGHPIAAYFRAQLVPALRDSNGNNLGGDFVMSKPNGNKIVFEPFKNSSSPDKCGLKITLEFEPGWSNNWFYSSTSNCFYYKKSVDPGAKTDFLLSRVKFEGTADWTVWRDCFQLDILTDSIQTLGAIQDGVWPEVKVNSDKILELKPSN